MLAAYMPSLHICFESYRYISYLSNSS